MQTGENVSIAGFIITGNASKKIILRGIGPSLTGVGAVLADPVLELHGSDGSVIISNNNWRDNQETKIQNTGLAPTNNLESAIVATLAPGAYTALLRGKNQTSGVGVVEMYDLDVASDSKLANISARGLVETGPDVMIAGFIFGNGTASERVIVRALGPSLARMGVANVLADPTLELHDGNGTLLIANDNWKDNPAQAALITASGLAPRNRLESAIIAAVPPGAYTAIVAGKNGGIGVGVMEVYHLQ